MFLRNLHVQMPAHTYKVAIPPLFPSTNGLKPLRQAHKVSGESGNQVTFPGRNPCPFYTLRLWTVADKKDSISGFPCGARGVNSQPSEYFIHTSSPDNESHWTTLKSPEGSGKCVDTLPPNWIHLSGKPKGEVLWIRHCCITFFYITCIIKLNNLFILSNKVLFSRYLQLPFHSTQ